MVVEQEEWTHALPGNHQEELRITGKKTASRAR